VSYDEHLISMAGGDGDLHEGEHAIWCNGHAHFGPCRRGRVTGTEKAASPGGDGESDVLGEIAARIPQIPASEMSRTERDRAYLLAMVREQRAVIERVEAVADKLEAIRGYGRVATHLRIALTATEAAS